MNERYTHELWEQELSKRLPNLDEHADNPFLTVIEKSASVTVKVSSAVSEVRNGCALLYAETFDRWYVLNDDLLRDEYGWRLNQGDKATKEAILSHYAPEADFLHEFPDEQSAREYYMATVRGNKIAAGKKVDEEMKTVNYKRQRKTFF